MSKTVKKLKDIFKIGKWPIITAGVLLTYLVVSLVVSSISNKVDETGIKIGSLTRKQTLNAIEQENRENVSAVADFNYYGESLNLFRTKYYIGIKYAETFAGQNIVLVNLETNQQIKFEVLSDKLDQEIMLSKLDDGFYAVYESDAYGKISRLYMENVLTSDNKFTTICRNNTIRTIELIANAQYFDGEKTKEPLLDKNYLYFKVTSQTAPEAQYDIAIVTSPSITGNKAVSLVGEDFGTSSEAEQLNDIAMKVKEQLEAQGYRVTLIKNNYGENINFYGENGVVGRVYNSQVKYMIFLDMIKEDTKMTRTKLVYSQYTQNEFAHYVFNALRENTTIFTDSTRLTNSSVTKSKYLNDNVNYDGDYEIREVSGSVLGTGIFSATSTENAFAKEYNYGVNCIKLILCNIGDASSVNNFKQNKDAIANAIAKGTIEYLK